MTTCAIVHRARTGLFVGTLLKILGRKVDKCNRLRGYRGIRVHVATTKTAVLTLAMTILLLCGDIESNPGPVRGAATTDSSMMESSQHSEKEDTASENGGSPVMQQHQQEDDEGNRENDPNPNVILQALRDMEERMESKNRQSLSALQKHLEEKHDKGLSTIQQRMGDLHNSLSEKIQKVETNQNELQNELRNLQTENKELREENRKLQDQVRILNKKYEQTENTCKEKNLRFVGLRLQEGEDWQDTEETVKEIVRDGLKIEEDIYVDKIYRAGKAIVVQLLSLKQKMLILKCSYRLKDNSKYEHIFIQEDFSHDVRLKRRELATKAKSLRAEGVKAKLRKDKLITDSGIYTFDLERSCFMQSQNKRKQTEITGSEEGTARGGHMNKENENEDFPRLERHDIDKDKNRDDSRGGILQCSGTSGTSLEKGQGRSQPQHGLERQETEQAEDRDSRRTSNANEGQWPNKCVQNSAGKAEAARLETPPNQRQIALRSRGTNQSTLEAIIRKQNEKQADRGNSSRGGRQTNRGNNRNTHNNK